MSGITSISQIVPGLMLSCCLNAILPAQDPDRDKPQPLEDALRNRCMLILQDGLASDEFWPSMHAAEGLTQAGAKAEVIAALTPRLPAETNDQRRCGLARELVRAGDAQHLPLLFQILVDETSIGRTHAAESLLKLGETGDKTLLQAAMQPTNVAPLRIMAAGALIRGGNTTLLDTMRSNLKSDDQTTRNLSAWVLGRFGNNTDVELLLPLLKAETDEMSRTFLAVSLASLHSSEGREALIIQFHSENPTARAMAAEFASISRTIEACSELTNLLNDPVPDVRIRSAHSLIALSMPAEKQTRPE